MAETYEQKRERAFREGKRHEYIACPLCHSSRSIKIWKGKPNFAQDENPEVVQVRYGLGGRGVGGFYRNEKEGIKLNTLKVERPELYSNLKKGIAMLNQLFNE